MATRIPIKISERNAQTLVKRWQRLPNTKVLDSGWKDYNKANYEYERSVGGVKKDIVGHHIDTKWNSKTKQHDKQHTYYYVK